MVKYFEYIPPELKKSLILTRLGYRKGLTDLSEQDRQFVDDAIKEALLLCHLRGAYSICEITCRDEGQVVLENGVEFTSGDLAQFLSDSTSVVLIAATAGSDVYDKTAELMREGQGALSIVYDATASQVADTALDWIVGFINKSIAIRGLRLTKRRFSPGYGDLPLHFQKTIYDILSLKKVGVSITESFMLVPEKSVIALAGIGVADG
jgi:hypothetical protein